jgi:hypothetical protein
MEGLGRAGWLFDAFTTIPLSGVAFSLSGIVVLGGFLVLG